jgi:hypothetical protein
MPKPKLRSAKDGATGPFSVCALSGHDSDGGADEPSNMEWQTIAEARAKDRIE